LNGALDSHIEVTYGYNPLILARYSAYLKATATNPRLLSGLNIGATANPATREIHPEDQVNGRFTIPERVVVAQNSDQSKSILASLNPKSESVVEAPIGSVSQDTSARLQVIESSEERFRVQYSVTTPTLARASIPWFPGWNAELDGDPQPIYIVDHAFMGVVLPKGTGILTLSYAPRLFLPGTALSLIAIAMAVTSLSFARRR
jgi:hypothetical protein